MRPRIPTRRTRGQNRALLRLRRPVLAARHSIRRRQLHPRRPRRRPDPGQWRRLPLRSYLYAADLAIWLWKILFDGASARPYNVGSSAPISIADLAAAVRDALGAKVAKVAIEIAQKPTPSQPPSCYVPDTTRAQSELALREWIDLPEAIRRTAQWSSP